MFRSSVRAIRGGPKGLININASAPKLSNIQRTYASVSNAGVGVSKPPSNLNAGKEGDVEEEKKPLTRPEHLSKEAFDQKREKKLQQYQALLQEKAKREGFSSVEEMVEKEKERKAAKDALTKTNEETSDHSGLSEKDAKLAQDILKRVEAEAERKIKSGNFSSGPSALKTLGDIIDLEKVRSDSPETISQLWTQYHSLKNKLSAVIPARQYAEMVSKAKQYPQFLLPLPRTIVGSDDVNKTANVAPGERKNGYEMQYMEWGFLPKPDLEEITAKVEQSVNHSHEEKEVIEKATPTTVLFTPLAEYKLRQEFAQPVLIVTHYTDLALSKGIVLLRGEITEGQDAQSAPTGMAAAIAASQAGETSTEKLDRLKAPLQSQGKLSQQDAQLLTVMLQRFYMPVSPTAGPQPGAQERQELLDAFHGDPERFDVDKLCKSAFEF
ncbi:hypothetical protein L7F22_050290 [Adiantum nelumboides]|nr:hypothetical protein [Adiantum nelumboides]